ncbi:hypothetical protein Q3O97_26520, partial [Ralstonia pseudosolanacearum]|uniref:hypothetical protein n=1 Tax=Ralstonia pseudosolanacearum TaxID=1310165 RepID=UPI0026F9D129
ADSSSRHAPHDTVCLAPCPVVLAALILATKCKAIFGMPIELNVGLGIRRAAARSNTAKPSFKVASRQRGLGCIYASDP